MSWNSVLVRHLPKNAVIERLALLLRKQEIPDANLGPQNGYSKFFVVFLSLSRQLPG